jgi:hypothetical protein
MARLSPRRSEGVFIAVLAFIAMAGGVSTQAALATAPKTASAVTSKADENGWTEAEANRLSGRNLTVTCAGTPAEWAADLTDVGLPAGDADGYYGLSTITSGEMRLSAYVCEGLRLGLTPPTRRANDLQVAWAVDVLLHESVHMGRFTPDEALAEACARDGLPGELHRLYGIPYASPEMRRLTLAATWFRRTQPAAYQGGTCSAS